MIKAIVITAILAASAASAESRWSKIYHWSAVALVASSTADVASSVGKLEANPLLRSGDGRFGARGAGIKLGACVAVLLIQNRARKSGKSEKPMAIANFAVSGLYGGAAIHNWRSR